MSHILTAKAKIMPYQLDCLRTAATTFGGVMIRKNTYNWYGARVGNDPMPAGMRAEELGTCEFAIQVPGINYEVGVVRSGDHYILAYDFYGSSGRHDGLRLKQLFGDGLAKLSTEFNMEVVRQTAASNGYITTESVDAATGEKLLILNQY